MTWGWKVRAWFSLFTVMLLHPCRDLSSGPYYSSLCWSPWGWTGIIHSFIRNTDLNCIFSTFGGLEAMITGLCDEFPKTLGKHREAFVAALLAGIYLCALPTCTYVGTLVILWNMPERKIVFSGRKRFSSNAQYVWIIHTNLVCCFCGDYRCVLVLWGREVSLLEAVFILLQTLLDKGSWNWAR